jgi:Foie gras liver health family 1
LQPVMKIYRVEKWYELLEEGLVLALDCARKLEDGINVQRYSLELLSDGKIPCVLR